MRDIGPKTDGWTYKRNPYIIIYSAVYSQGSQAGVQAQEMKTLTVSGGVLASTSRIQSVKQKKGDSTCLAWYLSDASQAVYSDQFNQNLQCVCRPPQSPLYPALKECSAPHHKSMSALNQLCPVRKVLLTRLSTLCSEIRIWSLTLITACRAKLKWFSFSFYVLRPLLTLSPQYRLS